MLDILHSAQTGHEYHPVWVFADEARMLPQYACDWLRDLFKIYGYRQLGDVSFSHQYDKFFGILNETQEIAEMYQAAQCFVLPSFREVERVFGVKPLIYPFLPFENEKSSVWLSYPESMQKMMGGRVKKRRSKLMNKLRHFWFFLRGKSKHV